MYRLMSSLESKVTTDRCRITSSVCEDGKQHVKINWSVVAFTCAKNSLNKEAAKEKNVFPNFGMALGHNNQYNISSCILIGW